MYRILELLRRQEGFLSGEDIGRELSITRAAVWKGIKKLREEGYEIEAVTNRGYRLTNPETMYNKRELEQGLKTKTMGQSIYFYEETDTTNNRARELALEGAPEGTLVVAEKQTAGRGRRGKVWESPLGTGIWMSLVLRPQIMPAEASVLTLLCGLATAEAIEAETGLSAGIKWPNDILINGKKAVGILTEMDCGPFISMKKQTPQTTVPENWHWKVRRKAPWWWQKNRQLVAADGEKCGNPLWVQVFG